MSRYGYLDRGSEFVAGIRSWSLKDPLKVKAFFFANMAAWIHGCASLGFFFIGFPSQTCFCCHQVKDYNNKQSRINTHHLRSPWQKKTESNPPKNKKIRPKRQRLKGPKVCDFTVVNRKFQTSPPDRSYSGPKQIHLMRIMFPVT